MNPKIEQAARDYDLRTGGGRARTHVKTDPIIYKLFSYADMTDHAAECLVRSVMGLTLGSMSAAKARIAADRREHEAAVDFVEWFGNQFSGTPLEVEVRKLRKALGIKQKYLVTLKSNDEREVVVEADSEDEAVDLAEIENPGWESEDVEAL